MSTPIAPVPPPAPWLGGKRWLAERLVTRIHAIPHAIYAEPFLGMGGVFFRRRVRPRVEIVNDLSRDVATFFRVLQRHPTALVNEMLRWQVAAREEFERQLQVDPETLTDLERAARFYYLQRLAFSGKVIHRVFGVRPRHPSAFNILLLEKRLRQIHERLAGVVIERLPYDEFIAQYDRVDALFYLDPPYWGCEREYGKGLFARADFARLASILAKLKGRFLLSLNDTPETREIFAGFEIEAVTTRYGVGNADPGEPAAELIIGDGRGGGAPRQERLL